MLGHLYEQKIRTELELMHALNEIDVLKGKVEPSAEEEATDEGPPDDSNG